MRRVKEGGGMCLHFKISLVISKVLTIFQELQNLLDNAKNGVIYFSLGSNVQSVNMPDRLRVVLNEAFAELPYTILWKYEAEDLPGKPPNVIIKKWLPQQDVLGKLVSFYKKEKTK